MKHSKTILNRLTWLLKSHRPHLKLFPSKITWLNVFCNKHHKHQCTGLINYLYYLYLFTFLGLSSSHSLCICTETIHAAFWFHTHTQTHKPVICRTSSFHFSTSKLLSESESTRPAATTSAFIWVFDFFDFETFSPLFFFFTDTGCSKNKEEPTQ